MEWLAELVETHDIVRGHWFAIFRAVAPHRIHESAAALSAGCAAFVSKPYVAADLIGALMTYGLPGQP